MDRLNPPAHEVGETLKYQSTSVPGPNGNIPMHDFLENLRIGGEKVRSGCDESQNLDAWSLKGMLAPTRIDGHMRINKGRQGGAPRLAAGSTRLDPAHPRPERSLFFRPRQVSIVTCSRRELDRSASGQFPRRRVPPPRPAPSACAFFLDRGVLPAFPQPIRHPPSTQNCTADTVRTSKELTRACCRYGPSGPATPSSATRTGEDRAVA
jgi:hypothetical protein